MSNMNAFDVLNKCRNSTYNVAEQQTKHHSTKDCKDKLPVICCSSSSHNRNE